jgi:hypothetical protein
MLMIWLTKHYYQQSDTNSCGLKGHNPGVHHGTMTMQPFRFQAVQMEPPRRIREKHAHRLSEWLTKHYHDVELVEREQRKGSSAHLWYLPARGSAGEECRWQVCRKETEEEGNKAGGGSDAAAGSPCVCVCFLLRVLFLFVPFGSFVVSVLAAPPRFSCRGFGTGPGGPR